MIDDLSRAPLGTLAPAIMGGAWCRVIHGWQWNGHAENTNMRGSTFPRPGGDWTGELIYPNITRTSARCPGLQAGEG